MSIPQDGGLPETAEAARVLRAQQERDAEIDAEYTNPDFVAQKKADNLANSPYAPFVDPEETTTHEIEVFGTLELGVSCEYAPLIFQLQNNGNIDQTQATQLIKSGINSSNFHEVIPDCELTTSQSEELTASLEYISSENTTTQAENEIQDTFGDIFSEFQDPDPQKTSPTDLEAYREIVEHYVPHGETREAQKVNLHLAIQMAAGDIVNKGVLDLNSSNQTSYDIALTNIFNPDKTPKEWFEGLQSITQIANSDQAEKGGRRKLADNFRNKQAKEKEAGAQRQASQTAQAEMIAKNDMKPQTQETPTTEEVPKSGDVFTASNLDIQEEQSHISESRV